MNTRAPSNEGSHEGREGLTVSRPIDLVLSRLGESVQSQGSGWMARCPCAEHQDRHASLSVSAAEDGRVLLKDHGGCPTQAVVQALGLHMADLFPKKSRQVRRARERTAKQDESRAAVRDGCTLEAYATAKRLPAEFLTREFGLSSTKKAGAPALRVPYRNPDGQDTDVRYRLALTGPDRFSWCKGANPTLYALDRLHRARAVGFAILVEGESDCQTGWYQEYPVLGIPGAALWKDAWAVHLDGLAPVFLIQESGQGGRTLRDALAASPLRDRLRVVLLDGAKDLSDLHCQDPTRFRERLQHALDQAQSPAELASAEAAAERAALWAVCADLAQSPRILDRLQTSLRDQGVAGEARVTNLVFLALVSRFLRRLVSVVLKAVSSAGKSYLVQQTLRHVSASAYYELSAMSEKVLVYSDEPLAHRLLVICEAAGLSGDFQTYALRTLLSEGHLRYETTEKGRDGQFHTRLIEREGPTGLILTTTEIALHPENETRLLSIPIDESREQTERILLAHAQDEAGEPPSLDAWHALHTWLALGEHRVGIPFATALATQIPPVATRLRRDFPALLSLIRAHALLHQATRERDQTGAIIATLDDYDVVRDLVADLFATAADVSVSEPVRDAVGVVRCLSASGDPCSVTQVARELEVDTSTASRRIKTALRSGYLVNRETKPGRRYQLVLGESLPEETPVLPSVATLADPLHGAVQGFRPTKTGSTTTPCTLAEVAEGDDPAPAWVTDTGDDWVRV